MFRFRIGARTAALTLPTSCFAPIIFSYCSSRHVASSYGPIRRIYGALHLGSSPHWSGPGDWLAVLAHSSSGDPEVRTIRARDACDPTTFNAVLGPSACVAGHHGKLTFSVQIL